MNFTKIDVNTAELLSRVLQEYPLVVPIVEQIVRHNGRALLVGGAVRDLVLGHTPKDLDIEVHAISAQELEKILGQFGWVNYVGKVFGVLRLNGLAIDWSLPRKDSAGRHPQVIIDERMGFKDAFARRDLTMNAMGIDLVTHELIDPFDGLYDLQHKILRAPDKARFIEDPLRFYRVMQFIGRFEMEPDELLQHVCMGMEVSTVSIERIEAEFEKLLLQSRYPSLGIRWIAKIGRLQEILPELAATIGVEQSVEWHPEGDVFEHSMQALDAAAYIINGNGICNIMYDDEYKKLVLMYAALCHDLGKAQTTKKIDGVWRSLGHETVGAELAQKMLRRITRKASLIADVKALVALHMIPMQLVANDAKHGAYKRLAHKLAPHGSLQMLADLCLADKRGRSAHGHEPLKQNFEDVDIFIRKSQAASVDRAAEKPILHGRDLLDVVSAGPELGRLVKRAYEIQIEEGVVDVQELKKRVLDE